MPVPCRPSLCASRALVVCGFVLFDDPPQLADSASPPPTATASASPGAASDGFGGSVAWWARDTGRLPDGSRARIADLLFSRSGLRLSMYRDNFVGGGQIASRARSTPGYLWPDGTYNWSA